MRNRPCGWPSGQPGEPRTTMREGGPRSRSGIFLQHHDHLDEAGKLLAEAVGRLDAAHPDAVCAEPLAGHPIRRFVRLRRHAGGAGRCFRSFVLERLPPGLIEELRVELEEGEFQIHVELHREPDEDELELMNKTFQHAQQQFRKRLNEGLY